MTRILIAFRLLLAIALAGFAHGALAQLSIEITGAGASRWQAASASAATAAHRGRMRGMRGSCCGEPRSLRRRGAPSLARSAGEGWGGGPLLLLLLLLLLLTFRVPFRSDGADGKNPNPGDGVDPTRVARWARRQGRA